MTADTTPKTPLLSRREAADFLRLRPQTLAVWAMHGRINLPIVKIGGRVLYRRSDLEALVHRSTRQLPHAQPQPTIKGGSHG